MAPRRNYYASAIFACLFSLFVCLFGNKKNIQGERGDKGISKRFANGKKLT